MSLPEDRRKERQELKNAATVQNCVCGEPLIKRNGNFLFFRKYKTEVKGRVKEPLDVIVQVISSEPVGFMFICGKCGLEQTPIIKLVASDK